MWNMSHHIHVVTFDAIIVKIKNKIKKKSNFKEAVLEYFQFMLLYTLYFNTTEYVSGELPLSTCQILSFKSLFDIIY